MEGIILLGLLGAGYLLNDKDDKHKTYPQATPPLYSGSGNTVYDINNYKDSKFFQN